MKPRFKLHIDGRLSVVTPDAAPVFARPPSRAPERQDRQRASGGGSGSYIQGDIHPADVIAALRKCGTSLRQIAQANGYTHIARVLHSPWLAAEQLVAKALGKRPEDIWPSRYRNPANRALAFQQTRKITVTMPRKRRATASEARA